MQGVGKVEQRTCLLSSTQLLQGAMQKRGGGVDLVTRGGVPTACSKALTISIGAPDATWIVQTITVSTSTQKRSLIMRHAVTKPSHATRQAVLKNQQAAVAAYLHEACQADPPRGHLLSGPCQTRRQTRQRGPSQAQLPRQPHTRPTSSSNSSSRTASCCCFPSRAATAVAAAGGAGRGCAI